MRLNLSLHVHRLFLFWFGFFFFPCHLWLLFFVKTFFFTDLKMVILCVWIFVCMYMCISGAYRGHKSASDLLGRRSRWLLATGRVLEIEVPPSRGVASTPDRLVTSPASLCWILRLYMLGVVFYHKYCKWVFSVHFNFHFIYSILSTVFTFSRIKYVSFPS